MHSPRLGGRGRGSARGTPRMGTPSGSIGGFATPAAKGSLMLGKSKGRLRPGMEYGNMSATLELSNTMITSREGSYDVGEGEVGASRMGSFQSAGPSGGEKGRIFAKSEEITAMLHEGLPLDVVKSMGIDDAWRETYTGGYDTITGYTWLASGRNTWVWKHHRMPLVPPTVHVFGSPPSRGELSPPQVILVPLQSNATNEPASLLISSDGSIRFWSSIFLGLSGADRFVSHAMGLSAHGKHPEIVTRAEPLIPALSLSTKPGGMHAISDPDVIVGTSKGRIFRIIVSRRGDSGDWFIDATAIHDKPVKPTGLFSGLFAFGSSRQGAASASNASAHKQGGGSGEPINAIAMGAVETDGVDVWVLDSSNLSVWRVSDIMAQAPSSSNLSDVERLIFKADAVTGIQEKLLELYGLADGAESSGDMYESSDVGFNMAGGLPRQMSRREANIRALGVELLDLVLVKSTRRTETVDPREPSTPGSRDDDEMETDATEVVEELTPVILLSYTVPIAHSGDGGGISWQSAAASNKQGSKRYERSYAAITGRIVGADQSAGSKASPTQSLGAPLTFETPSILPYSDLVNARGISTASPGVNIGYGPSKAPAKEGWFAPRLAALQATVAKDTPPRDDDSDGDNDATLQQWQERLVTILVATFEGGMVFTINDGPFKDHLFMKQSHPFPRSIGFGVVGGNPKSSSSYLPYSLAATPRLSSSALLRPSSRSQMLPPTQFQHIPKPPLAEIVYMATTGIVSVSVDFEKVANVDERSGGSNQIRSVMEQAILYGPVPDNPFAFRFSSNVNAGNLMVAASQLSLETIQSSPKLIKKQLGLTNHLADRAARLEWLIQFINDNGALNRLNLPLRTALATHAEKIAAAQGVWAWYDGTRFKGPNTAAGRGSVERERTESMLVQAVDIYQEEEESGDGWPSTTGNRRRSGQRLADIVISPNSSIAAVEHSFDSEDDPGAGLGMSWSQVPKQTDDFETTRPREYVDPVRVFFKVKVEDIGELVPCSVRVVKATVNSFDKSQAWPDVTVQAGRLALVLLEAALQFRKTHASTYGIDFERPVGTPWTSEPRILESCVYLFEECGRSAGDAMGDEAKKVMEGLASVVCEGYKEQLAAARTRPGADVEAVQEKFITVRRKVWKMLVQRGSGAHAFKLAEDYGDFRALTELCYQSSKRKTKNSAGETVKSLDYEELAKRIDHYVSTFKQDFAFELYQWWIREDMAHEIFQQSGSHMDYVDAFFDIFDYPNLAWIHQLGKNQFSAASATLLDLAQSDTRLGPIKFLLSMGKLSELVELDSAGDRDESFVRDMDEEVRVYDELLDLVDVQQKLRKDLLETVADVNMSFAVSIADVGTQNEDILTKAAAITERVATRLKQDGFTETLIQFKRLVANLVGDKRLGVEDTLDLLGLKDTAQQTGFSVGLHLVYETRTLADARREIAIRSLWRRIYICDNWRDLHDTRSYTDAQVNERLRSTALFAALRDLYTSSLASMMNANELSKLVRRPSDALEIPTEEEMMDRYSQMGYYGESGYVRYTKADISALYFELEKERDMLDEYADVLEGAGLWEEVARLEESERPLDENEPDVGDTRVDMRGNSLGIDVSME